MSDQKLYKFAVDNIYFTFNENNVLYLNRFFKDQSELVDDNRNRKSSVSKTTADTAKDNCVQPVTEEKLTESTTEKSALDSKIDELKKHNPELIKVNFYSNIITYFITRRFNLHKLFFIYFFFF